MEVELFGELVVLLEHFWHRYVERPPTSKFSPGSSVGYAEEGEKALLQLWRFCLAINFLQLGRLTMKKLIKSRFSVEYQLATGHWNWLRTGGLGLKQRQHIRVQLRQYVEQFRSGLSHPQSVGFYLSTSAKRIRYIHGFARALHFPERLCFVFFLTELPHPHQSASPSMPPLLNKEILHRLYQAYISQEVTPLRFKAFIQAQGYNYRHVQQASHYYFGAPFVPYFHTHKMLLSLIEIMFTSKNLQEIGLEFGYDNYDSYYQSFVKAFSQKPSAVLRYSYSDF